VKKREDPTIFPWQTPKNNTMQGHPLREGVRGADYQMLMRGVNGEADLDQYLKMSWKPPIGKNLQTPRICSYNSLTVLKER
jgi:hypothetical protein